MPELTRRNTAPSKLQFAVAKKLMHELTMRNAAPSKLQVAVAAWARQLWKA